MFFFFSFLFYFSFFSSPFFLGPLCPASVPELFFFSCVTLAEREEAIGRPFSQLTRQTRYNGEDSPYSSLTSIFSLSIIPSLPTIASPIRIGLEEIQRSAARIMGTFFFYSASIVDTMRLDQLLEECLPANTKVSPGSYKPGSFPHRTLFLLLLLLLSSL